MAYQDVESVKVEAFESNGIDDNATSTKFTVSDTGIDVTGTVTCDGLVAAEDGDDIALSGGRVSIISDTNGNGLNLNCIGTPANYFLRVQDDSATKLVIDPSGNVGIGVTPATDTYSGATALQISAGGTDAFITAESGSSNRVALSGNAKKAGSNWNSSWEYIGDTYATQLGFCDGDIQFRVAPSGTADNAISWTTAMTIDDQGDVLTNGYIKPAAGYGIHFGANSDGTRSVTSNVLDDYEEGTFDVTLTAVGGNTATRACRYTKIGNMVTVDFAYTGTTSTFWNIYGYSGDAVTITSSLPFTPIVNGGFACSVTRSLGNGNDLCVGWRRNSATLYLGTADTNSYYPIDNAAKDSSQSNITIQGSGTFMVA